MSADRKVESHLTPNSEQQRPKINAGLISELTERLKSIPGHLSPTDSIHLPKISSLLGIGQDQLEECLQIGSQPTRNIRHFREDVLPGLLNAQLGGIFTRALKAISAKDEEASQPALIAESQSSINYHSEYAPAQKPKTRSSFGRRYNLVGNVISKEETMSGEYVTTQDLSAYGLSPDRLRGLRMRGTFSAYRFHVTVFYRREDIPKILEEKAKIIPRKSPNRENDYYHNPNKYRHGDPQEIAQLLESFGGFISTKQAQILRLRSSLADGRFWTLSEIKEFFGYKTNAGVSTTELRALSKLRQSKHQSQVA